jgi:hypothetical protein
MGLTAGLTPSHGRGLGLEAQQSLCTLTVSSWMSIYLAIAVALKRPAEMA